jgi:hypothetical protein
MFLYILYLFIICYHDILQLQKVAIQGFELGPCHMIQIFASHAVPLSQLEVLQLGYHAPEYIVDNVTENASSKSIYRYIVNYI